MFESWKFFRINWWAQQDSNLRPADYESVKNGLSCSLLTAPETNIFFLLNLCKIN